ncbi:hypothetical protein BROUX41_002601 [Berkeleyomyces rouxiae]|uniref:uncharacterized protein n=1 Tax=Berkeleyomyces rouxiae TaxID=2035830 RepID=UPI003B7FC4A5
MPSYHAHATDSLHFQSTDGEPLGHSHLPACGPQSFKHAPGPTDGPTGKTPSASLLNTAAHDAQLPSHHYDFPATEYNDTSLHSASTPTPVEDRFDQSSVISSTRLSFTTTSDSGPLPHSPREPSRQSSMASMSKYGTPAMESTFATSPALAAPGPSITTRMASLEVSTNRSSVETPLRPASLPPAPSNAPLAVSSAAASASASRLPHIPQQPTSAPPPPPPPASGLKHRHTLEVPKHQSNRTSRDSADMATHASGRFSPSVVPPAVGRRPSLSIGRRNTRSMQSDAPRDEVPVDDDARRWAEAVRQKRASKRRRKEEEDDDRVLVGTKVDEKHANWVTAYNMLTGIRVSVSRTNAKLDRQLTNADFDSKQKSTFDIAGNELVPSAKYDFKFKDYAPWVFRDLRKLFRLDPADYLMSLTGKYILSEMGSPGKSGSFFYYSRDYKYIIKTIHHGEHKFLRHILKDYYSHVKENPNTLLSQFYGLHRVKTPFGKKIHFVVMNNIFPPHRDIHQTFDLKGSTIGRDYNEDDIKSNPRATLKDLNWMRRKRHLELGIQKKQLFMDQLTRDVRLLQRLHIMDYSLLVGIHDLSKGNDENLRDKTLQVFNPGGEHDDDAAGGSGANASGADGTNPALLRTPSKLENARKARELREMIRQERPIPMAQAASRMPEELDESHRQNFLFNQDDGGFQATHENNEPANEIYYLGVIDCLTKFGFVKKMEHFWKSLNNDRTKISAIPPEEYGERFFDFIENITMSPEEAQREEVRLQREAEAAAVARASERSSTWSSRNRVSAAVPPMPTQAPPPPPPPKTNLDHRYSTDNSGATSSTATGGGVPPPMRANEDTSLPVVHESGESSPIRSVSRASQQPPQSITPQQQQPQYRPRTPNTSFMPGAPPPTPPKSDHHLNFKAESGDSGYCAVPSPGGDAKMAPSSATPAPGHKPSHSRGQTSIDKELPSLPASEQVVRPVYV